MVKGCAECSKRVRIAQNAGGHSSAGSIRSSTRTSRPRAVRSMDGVSARPEAWDVLQLNRRMIIFLCAHFTKYGLVDFDLIMKMVDFQSTFLQSLCIQCITVTKEP